MSSDYIMTMQQAQMEMELYKKVFTVVRLLDKREFRLEENDNPGGDMELCHCYDFWKKEKHVRIVLLPGHSRRSQCGQSWNTRIQIFIK